MLERLIFYSLKAQILVPSAQWLQAEAVQVGACLERQAAYSAVMSEMVVQALVPKVVELLH